MLLIDGTVQVKNSFDRTRESGERTQQSRGQILPAPSIRWSIVLSADQLGAELKTCETRQCTPSRILSVSTADSSPDKHGILNTTSYSTFKSSTHPHSHPAPLLTICAADKL